MPKSKKAKKSGTIATKFLGPTTHKRKPKTGVSYSESNPYKGKRKTKKATLYGFRSK